MSKPPKEYFDRLDDEVALCLKLFGDWVNHRRNALRLSQDQTAALAGLSRTEMHMVEQGETDIKLSTFIRLCHPLRRGIGEVAAHLEHLLDHPEDRPPQMERQTQRGKNTRRSAQCR
jgi:transcriptional regulator with XRE-family HTH domain